MLREYKNICGKVRSIKFSIKSKQFHQSIESACNDFRNKNARSVWLKLKKLSRPMYSNSISSSVLKDKQGNFLYSRNKFMLYNIYIYIYIYIFIYNLLIKISKFLLK